MQDAMPGLSAYHQTFGNPVAFADPLGLWPEPGLNRNIGESAGEQWMREHGMGSGYTNPVFAQGPSYQQQQMNQFFSSLPQGKYQVDSDDDELFRLTGFSADKYYARIFYRSFFTSGRNILDTGVDPTNTKLSNLNLALTVGGAIYGSLEGATVSQGYWLGRNGKYNSVTWGGNKYTGARAGALRAAGVYKLAGRATVVASAGLGIYLTIDGYQQDGGQFGYNAQLAAASSAGGIVGGVAGAKAGALVGASIGAFFGGVGAVPGAVIGGFVGGIGGGLFGGYAGESAVNYYHGR